MYYANVHARRSCARMAQKQWLYLPRFSKLASVTMESILALAAVVGTNVDQEISWLQSKGLLSQNRFCPACNQPMDFQQRNDIMMKWRCPDSSFKMSVSLHSRIFFEQYRLQLRVDS